MSNYQLAWLLYGVGVLGLLLVWWRLTDWNIPRPLKTLVRVLPVPLLLFPFTVEAGYSEMAPGWMVWLLAFLFDGTDPASRSGPTLFGVTLVVCAVWLVLDWLLLGRRALPARSKPAEVHRQA